CARRGSYGYDGDYFDYW
nr:immunoglobulin heavy chain junction region [Mus musculus]MBK4184458.1 immunoglobulin heavy chain junction region [Mus musculus]